MFCIFSHAEHAQIYTHVVLKVFDLDLTTANQTVGVLSKAIPPIKCHFTLVLSMTNMMV